MKAPKLLRIYLCIVAAVYIAQWRIYGGRHGMAAISALQIIATYLGTLFFSTSVYRLLFHRLRHFPGPFLAKLTKLYHASQIRNSDQYLFMERLHRKYGDFVRTGKISPSVFRGVFESDSTRSFLGPNEITIFTPEAINAIHSPHSECTKAAWYDNILPKQSVVTTRSKSAHDVRRRIWDQAFSIKALQQHEDKILHHAQILDAAISKTPNEPVNVTVFFEYFGFDVMGDVGYNKSFGMLESQKSHYAIETFKGGTIVLGTLSPIPWLIHTLFSLPFLAKGWEMYSTWAHEELQNRIKVSSISNRSVLNMI